MPKVGAHVSSSISLELSFERAQKIGADCFQIFISPPQQWFQNKHSEEIIEKFRKSADDSQIGPNYIHGTYLVNIGTQNPEHLEKSIDWLIYALNTSSKLGTKGVIFHPGSHKGLGFEKILTQASETLKKILDKSPTDNLLILEASAGAGGNIGGSFSELGRILKQVNDPRLKICLDTQHLFASGYDLRTPLTIKDVLTELKEEIGLAKLEVIHANDSKTDFHSGKDRHENIGDGFIGREGFENIINQDAFSNIPFILEVPGFSGNGPDKENIELLKSLIKN